MATSNQPEDQAAMRRLHEGDDLALNEIMNRWKLPLVSYLRRLSRHDHEAIDLAQETFVRVYQHRHRYQPNGKFSVWLFTIATNLCRNHFRWQQRHPTVQLETESNSIDGEPRTQPRSADLSPDRSLQAKEEQAAVRAAIAQLPVDLRTSLVLYEYEEMSYQEIAKIEDCSVKAVETRLYRARHLLKESLQKFLSH